MRAASPEQVLDYWLSQDDERLFRADPAFDAEVRKRFAATHEAAAHGACDAWAETAHGALALVIVLDQFSRNLHRGSPTMLAQDDKALETARLAIECGFDEAREVRDHRRWFYLPFMHSERLADQIECVALHRKAKLQGSLFWACGHCDIIRRFGRFPHRNALLGRASTEDERRYLEAGGFAG